MQTTRRPMPPIPRNDQTYEEFIRGVTPAEFLDLVLQLTGDDTRDEPEIWHRTRDVSNDLMIVMMEDITPDNPEYAIAVLEWIADQPEVNGENFSGVYLPDLLHRLLNRGLDQVEDIVWKKLLYHSDDSVFETTYAELIGLPPKPGNSVYSSHRCQYNTYDRELETWRVLTLWRVTKRWVNLSKSERARVVAPPR